MNWEALGAIGEIVGAIAVILTLFYLAAQIRSSTEANRAQTFQALFDGLTAHSNHMFSSGRAELTLKGFRSYVDLSASEKLEFGSLMTNLFNYIEASYRTSGQGLLGEETMVNWSWYLRNRLLCYPGVCEWWSKTEGLFPPEMCDWVRRQLDNPDKTEDPYGVYLDG
jgi:hypothetical protein